MNRYFKLHQLSELLDTLTREKWEEVTSITERIKQTWKPVLVRVSIIEDRRELVKLEKPSATYSPNSREVEALLQKIYELDLILDFNWKGWTKGSELAENPLQEYEKLSLNTLLKLVSAVTRNDYFCEGYFERKVEDGTIIRILDALTEKLKHRWYNQEVIKMPKEFLE